MRLRRRTLAEALAQAGRLLCALAIAVVTTFHVCDVASARTVDILSVTAETLDQTNASDVAAVEKCHICAVVHSLAAATTGSTQGAGHVVPPGEMASLTPFSQSYTGPPPRA